MAVQVPFGDIVLRNLAVLLLVALPAGVLALFVNEAWLVQEGARLSPSDLLLVYLTLLLPIAFGGYVHQILVLWVVRRYGSTRTRVVGTLSSPLVLVGLVFMIYTPLLVMNALPLVVGLIFYVALIQYPSSQRQTNSA